MTAGLSHTPDMSFVSRKARPTRRVASPQALNELQVQSNLLLTKIKFARVRGQRLMQEFTSSENPATRAAAKELAPIIPEVLGSLSQAEESLKRIEPLASKINGRNFEETLQHLDQAVTEGVMGFRSWGKQVDVQLGSLRDKNDKVAAQVTTLAQDRYKQAIRQLREEGASAEEAGEKAAQLPAVAKLISFARGAKAKVESLDTLLHEFKSIFDTSTGIIAKMRQAYGALESSLQPRKTAAKRQSRKRLRCVAKRIVLLAYLRSKSVED